MTEYSCKLVLLAHNARQIFYKYLSLMHHAAPVYSVSQDIPSFRGWCTKLRSLMIT